MKSFALAVLVSCASAVTALAQPRTINLLETFPTGVEPERGQAGAASLLDALPTSFEPNTGQFDADLRFVARGSGLALLLSGSGARFRLPGGREIDLTLAGGRRDAHISGESPLPGTVNYFLSRDPSEWRTNIPTFGRVRYEQVYPGIDVVYYGNRGRLEYDFEIAPGSDPRLIRMHFGVDGLAIKDDGDLELRIGSRAVIVERPKLYQDVDGDRRPVDGGFALHEDGTVGFRIGPYDAMQRLVIDPVLVYSTFIGEFDDQPVSAIVLDETGAVYLAGRKGRFGAGGPIDAFVAKLNPEATALVFSTYFGGTLDDWANDVALDAASNIYVTGLTQSVNFPTVASAQGGAAGGQDAFVTKLSPAGNVLLYSTYLGGNGVDDGGKLVVAPDGNAFVVGQTGSADFPVATGDLSGPTDGYLAHLDPSGSFVASTYIGGSGHDFASDLAFGPGTSLLITGGTFAADFPVTPGVTQAVFGGGERDGFVIRFNRSTWATEYATFLGGTHFDSGLAIVGDADGAAYVTGLTQSSDFPASTGAVQMSLGGAWDAFVTKLSADGTTTIYSTYLGGGGEDTPQGIAINVAGQVVVAGATRSNNFPTASPLQAARASLSFESDGFVAKLDSTATSLIYSTYLGGYSSGAIASAVVMDSNGDVYVSGSTSSRRFPSTAGAFQSEPLGSASYGFVARISDATPSCSYFLRPATVTAGPGASPAGRYVLTVVTPSGCAWTPETDDPWITVTSAGAAGIGHVLFDIQSNPGPTRTGQITVADQTVTITQAGNGCSYLMSSLPTQPSGGGAVAATLTTGAGCPWVISRFASWVTVNPEAGVGPGSITLTLAPHTGLSPRTASFSVGPTFSGLFNFSITQAPMCDITLSPTTASFPGAGGVGSIAVTVTPPTCAWSVVSNDSWVTPSTQGGVGSATVNYTVAPNPGIPSPMFGRSGSLTIGERLFSHSQDAPPFTSIPGQLPPSPAAGSSALQTFTFTFGDTNGAANLDVVNVLVNNFLDGRFACYIAYVRSINVLYLVDDPGTALLPGLVLDGSAGAIGNSQCLIDGSGSSVQVNGNLMTLTLKIAFENGFAGNKVVYQAARDTNGNNSGWVQMGVWHVPGAAATSPAVVSMAPARGGGEGYPFQFTFSDEDGYTDLLSTTILVNDYLDGAGACYLGYHVPSNTVFLLNDAGNGYLAPLVLGGTGTVANSQCIIRSQGSGAVGNGTTLTLTLVIEFQRFFGFAGNRVFYLSAQDATATSGWQSMGSWTVP